MLLMDYECRGDGTDDGGDANGAVEIDQRDTEEHMIAVTYSIQGMLHS